MSVYSADHPGQEWQDQKLAPTSSPTEGDMALMHAELRGLPGDLNQRPMLRTHKSFPYTLRTSGQPIHGANTPDSTGAPSGNATERINLSNIDEIEPNSELPTVTYGGSAPASPVSRLTPPSPNGEKLDESHELGADDVEIEDQVGDEQKPPMTAQELRAQKRKMKRFR
jgi:hypothetical protein